MIWLKVLGNGAFSHKKALHGHRCFFSGTNWNRVMKSRSSSSNLRITCLLLDPRYITYLNLGILFLFCFPFTLRSISHHRFLTSPFLDTWYTYRRSEWGLSLHQSIMKATKMDKTIISARTMASTIWMILKVFSPPVHNTVLRLLALWCFGTYVLLVFLLTLLVRTGIKGPGPTEVHLHWQLLPLSLFQWKGHDDWAMPSFPQDRFALCFIIPCP